MNIKSIQTKLKLILLFLGVLSASAVNLHAINDVQWVNVGVGDWFNADNWNTGSVPWENLNDAATINNGGTAVIDNQEGGVLYFFVSNGEVRLINSGTLRSVGGYIGGASGSEGRIIIDNNSYWDNSETDMQIGYNGGAGALYLNSGTVSTQSLVLGQGAGSTGLLVIGGDGSGKLNISSTPVLSGAGTSTVRFAHSGNITFSNPFYDPNHTMSVEHVSGTTTLTGGGVVNSLSVSGGILNVGDDIYLSLNSATVSDGTLGGTGAINGSLLTVESGGHWATTLDLSYISLTLNSGAVLDYYVDCYTGFDSYMGTALTVGDGVLVDFSNALLVADESYRIVGYDQEIDPSKFNATGLGEGIEGTFGIDGNYLVFNTTAVPEPSTYLLIGIGLGALLLTAHCRRKVQTGA
jgi:T5SS/PEP-CTERM-associated repeat protein